VLAAPTGCSRAAEPLWLHVRRVVEACPLAGDRRDEQVDHLAYHALRGQVWDKALQYCATPCTGVRCRGPRQSAGGWH